MKILWHSNAPWVGSGYGTQTETFVPRLKKLGHEMTVSCMYGLQGKPIFVDGVQVLPTGRDRYGNDILPAHTKYLKADIVITLLDAYAIEPYAARQFRWVPWVPVDTDPLAPDIEEALSAAYQPVAFSRFGMRKLAEAGFKPLYVPHGLDTSVFQPRGQKIGREMLKVEEDIFLAGIVAANKGRPGRKAFDQQIRAFARFHAGHPDSRLYLHTDLTEYGCQHGEDIDRLIALAGLPEEAVIRVDPYRYAVGHISQTEMSHLYSAMDVLLGAVRGGGFELPLVEAQSCGTPVITTDFSAMAELVFAGWKVGAADRFFYQNAYQVIPSVDDIIAALEEAYQTKQKGQSAYLQADARTGALTYDADRVAREYWQPVLAEIENRVRKTAHRLAPLTIQAQGLDFAEVS
ncbi:MAG: glycosyltransferase family 4 protein [Anaerolineae bacterium]|nr:glycosyltransferase family 4 protein [Anaerolineae bacterium]